MKFLIVNFVVFLAAILTTGNSLMLKNVEDFEFLIESVQNEDASIKMFYALLDKDMVSMRCDYNGAIDFQKQISPLDIYQYYENRGDENYYTLITKTAYEIERDVTFFSEERLSDLDYLRKIMPANKLSKNNENYHLNVGFGAPDISYTLAFFSNDELNATYPDLVGYFRKYDHLDEDPHITVIQHNHTFSTVLGQKTTKMSLSVSRYFGTKDSHTLVVNYTLNFIYNLPPSILGGGNLLINQMKEGVVALVRETRKVCEE